MSSVAYYSNNAWDNALLESVDLFSGRSTRLDEFFNTFGDDPTANFIRESLQFDLLCEGISHVKLNEEGDETEATDNKKNTIVEKLKGLWGKLVEFVKGIVHYIVNLFKSILQNHGLC